jgi:hypothetical protein
VPITLNVTTTVTAPSLSNRVSLRANYPNPFNPATSLRFFLPSEQRIQLHVYDLSGALVRTIADDTFGAGEHELIWRGLDHHDTPVGIGVYLYRITTESGDAFARRMTLIR